jgi:hypothetical protein
MSTPKSAAVGPSRASLIFRLCRCTEEGESDLCIEAACEIRTLLAVVELFVSMSPGMDPDDLTSDDEFAARMTSAAGMGKLLLRDYA